jgi:hypothetical protein
MTAKKKRTRPAATEPTSKSRRTKAVRADTAPVEHPPRSASVRAEAVQSPSALSPEVAASISRTVNESETPRQTEASIDKPATRSAVELPAESVCPANKLSALDAAAKVLGETAQAMNCAELIAAMAANGYWSSPRGRTPAGTLYSAILRELQTKGEKARFCKSERGKFALRRSV